MMASAHLPAGDHPGTPCTAQAAFAQALLDPSAPTPSGLFSHNGSDPRVRFNVYRNNVVSSLLAALADSTPALAAWLGSDRFAELALAYLHQQAPSSPVLNHYGAGFADFMTGYTLGAGCPQLASLARLELARTEAYHAADAQVLGVPELQAAFGDQKRLPALHIRLHPSVRLLHSPWPVARLWAEHAGQSLPNQASATSLSEGPESLLVSRCGQAVEVMPIDLSSLHFYQALAQGLALAPALAWAADADADFEPGFELSQSVAVLIRQHAICGVHFSAF